jgi:late competence protein required for DNA uptake (superfamily II DNA/RNA helicase)
MFDGSPMSEMQLAVDIQGRVTRQFVTRKGAVLSYEAGLTLAMQQGKWQFLLHPLASRT